MQLEMPYMNAKKATNPLIPALHWQISAKQHLRHPSHNGKPDQPGSEYRAVHAELPYSYHHSEHGDTSSEA